MLEAIPAPARKLIFGLDWVEAFSLAFLLCYLTIELVALGTKQRLISPMVSANAHRWMLWPAVLGILPNHFFSPYEKIWLWTPWLIIPIGLGVLYHDFILCNRLTDYQVWGWYLIFCIVGAVLWSQH